MMLTAFIFLLGLWLGLHGPTILGDLITYFQNRAIIKAITPIPINPQLLCKGKHSWLIAKTLEEKGYSTAKVCRVCGFIDGVNKMASVEAIDNIEQNNKIQKIEQDIYNEFWKLEDGDIARFFHNEIQNGLEFNKLTRLHEAGMTFGARFHKYKATRAADITKELKKSDA